MQRLSALFLFAVLLLLPGWNTALPQTAPTGTVLPVASEIPAASVTPANAYPPAGTPIAHQVTIQNPSPGQALQGMVVIHGNTAVEGFQKAELEFSYHANSSGTWFLIEESDAPVTGDLAQWDTNTITDGVYDLRLTVILADGSQTSVTVDGVRVRNYSAIETDTPTPPPLNATPNPGEALASTASPTATLTATPQALTPTFTPLPVNPAQLSTLQVWGSLGKGALAAAGLFALMGIYQMIHSLRRKG